jgi:hypothetical protein
MTGAVIGRLNLTKAKSAFDQVRYVSRRMFRQRMV